MTPETRSETIYGIAERKFSDNGYIKAQIVAADRRDIEKNPHYHEPVETEYGTSLFHWIGSKSEAEAAMNDARIVLSLNGIAIGEYPAAEANEDDYIAWREHLAEGEPFEPDDIAASLSFREDQDALPQPKLF